MATGNRRCRKPMTSLREGICILILVTLASMTITFHLSHHLTGLLQTVQSPPQDSTIGRYVSVRTDLEQSLRGRSIQEAPRGNQTGSYRLLSASGLSVRETHASFASAEQYRQLVGLLQETEEQLQSQKHGSAHVVVRGDRPWKERATSLVEFAFRRHSTQVEFRPDQETEGNNTQQWSILLCLNSSSAAQKECVVTSLSQGPMKRYQKVNMIPKIQRLLSRPDTLCSKTSNSTEGKWRGTDLDCSNISSLFLSDNVTRLPTESASCKEFPTFVLPFSSSAGMALVPCSGNNGRLARFASGVALKLPGNLVALRDAQPRHVTLKESSATTDTGSAHSTSSSAPDADGSVYADLSVAWSKALVWRFSVLVTSLSPLRAYLHPDGLAWEGLSACRTAKPHRSLSLSELQQIAAERHGNAIASPVSRLEEAVMSILTKWEFAPDEPSDRECCRCFQVLEMTALFNMTFHPFILQISASDFESHVTSLSDLLIRQKVLSDLSGLLLIQRNMSPDLARGLMDMGLATITKGQVCNVKRNFCLGPTDQEYLLDTLREQSAKTAWKRVYPSASAVRFTRLLQAGQQLFPRDLDGATANASPLAPGTSPSRDMRPTPGKGGRRTTADFHSFLLSLESFFRGNGEEQSEAFEDVNIPVDHGETRGERILWSGGDSSNTEDPEGCNHEPAAMPYLSSIKTQPLLVLSPPFNPLTTEYRADVKRDVLLLSVWACPQGCSSRARLQDKHNTDTFANFTLGLGENVLKIYVVDISHKEPWVLNTYILIIRRHDFDDRLGSLKTGVPHVVCTLKQDCSLPFAPPEPCGLQPVRWASSWSKYLSIRSSLPACKIGDEPGQWYLPCTHCREEDAQCFWHDAVWSSTDCQEPVLPDDKLLHCFTDKKVLFIGDSTNRGILHYLSQRINGSLWEWDKIHHLHVYSGLNNKKTLFSFAYYPQFWLPAQHRPVFDKAFYQLIRRTLPLHNSSNTVVVVGGVHWLGTHHLKVIRSALAREGLTASRIVVKGLGSGFHLPVSGIHQLSQKEQERLLWHNRQVLSYAKHSGMEVVDTFNMTMARYSHFLQGRCSCHFHRVVPEQTTKRSASQPLYPTTYKVEGDINAVYAEMVINRICKPP